MLYFTKRFTGWRIAIWHVTETIDELYSLFPDDDVVRTEAEKRFRAPSRILEWVAVRALLYDMLDRQVPILYRDNGAPYLPDYEHLDISISHTMGYVAVALAEEGEIGIDIEQKGERVMRVKSRFVREDERAETLDQMLLHWSAKETAFKMLNRDKVDFLKHFHIEPFDIDETEEGQFLLQETKTNDERLFQIHYKIFPDFVLTYSHRINEE